MGAPFCFRCGQKPEYMIKLEERIEERIGGELRGPFWTMCKSCIFELDWNEIFRRTITIFDRVDETEGLEEGA